MFFRNDCDFAPICSTASDLTVTSEWCACPYAVATKCGRLARCRAHGCTHLHMSILSCLGMSPLVSMCAGLRERTLAPASLHLVSNCADTLSKKLCSQARHKFVLEIMLPSKPNNSFCKPVICRELRVG